MDKALEETFEDHRVAREAQQYVTRPGTCNNCAKLVFDVSYESGRRPYNQYESTPIRRNFRCGLGGFAVVTQGSCAKHESNKPTSRSIK
jgi:hypothetical protein